MIHWFLHTIGVSGDVLAHLSQASLAFQHPLALWIGLPLLIPAGWWIYERQRQNLGGVPSKIRRWLTATRVIILLILVIVLSGPYLRVDETIDKKPILAYLFDDSQSMALPAGPFADENELKRAAEAVGVSKLDDETKKRLNKMSRAQFAKSTVDAHRKELIDAVADRCDLRFYRIADRLERLPVSSPAWTLPESKPTCSSTRLGDAVSQLVEEAAGREIAGIVLFSDGQNNAGVSPAEAVRAANEVSAPIFAAPCGTESPVRDLALADVFSPDLVSIGDTVHVTATVELQGYDNATVEALLLDGADNKTIDQKSFTLRGGEPQTVDLSFEAKHAGVRTLTVKLVPKTPLPEDLPENNSDGVTVRISDQKLRVLYVEGAPRWQFRFLKNAMRRDHGLGGVKNSGVKDSSDPNNDTPDILLETEARRSKDGAAAALPKTLDELAKYHTVILGDVSPQMLTSKFVDMLSEAVRDRGVGLIVAAGPQNMPGHFNRQLTDLLPVRLRRGAAGGIDAPVYKPYHLEVSPSGEVSDTMRLYDDRDRNDMVWSHMPPFYWCAAVERLSAGATMLAWNASVGTRFGRMPLVAQHYAGQGKVFFIGSDSTWGWRQNVGDRFFYKFWGQAIRFVARRFDAETGRKSWIEARPLRAQPGEQVEVEVVALDADGGPRRDAKLPLQLVVGEKERSLDLIADPMTPGRYTAQFIADAPGAYHMTFEPGHDEKPVEAQVQVSGSTAELRRPNIDVQALRQFGKVVGMDQLKNLPRQLKGEVKHVDLHCESSIWDNWLMLLVLVTVYCIDIGIRRLSGLT